MSEHKEGTYGVACVSALTTGGHMAKVLNGRGKHRGVTGIRQVQGGLGSPCAMVTTSEVKKVPPNEGGPGPNFSG